MDRMAAATKVSKPGEYVRIHDRDEHADDVSGGKFNLELFLPDDYPMCPPRIRFLTRIYHPNIDRLGRICLDVLKNNWSPALQIRTILLSIQALLGAPNPEDPLNEAVAKQWKVCDLRRFLAYCGRPTDLATGKPTRGDQDCARVDAALCSKEMSSMETYPQTTSCLLLHCLRLGDDLVTGIHDCSTFGVFHAWRLR